MSTLLGKCCGKHRDIKPRGKLPRSECFGDLLNSGAWRLEIASWEEHLGHQTWSYSVIYWQLLLCERDCAVLLSTSINPAFTNPLGWQLYPLFLPLFPVAMRSTPISQDYCEDRKTNQTERCQHGVQYILVAQCIIATVRRLGWLKWNRRSPRLKRVGVV